MKSKKSIDGTSLETVKKAIIEAEKKVMKLIKLIILFTTCSIISNCGKVGPLTLPEDKLDKTVISFPCDEDCKKRFEEEKQRQKSVTLQIE